MKERTTRSSRWGHFDTTIFDWVSKRVAKGIRYGIIEPSPTKNPRFTTRASPAKIAKAQHHQRGDCLAALGCEIHRLKVRYQLRVGDFALPGPSSAAMILWHAVMDLGLAIRLGQPAFLVLGSPKKIDEGDKVRYNKLDCRCTGHSYCAPGGTLPTATLFADISI